MTTVEQRLERLERSQKRYRVATIGLLCLVVAGVTMGQTSGPENIVCRRLTVMQEGGKAGTVIVGNSVGIFSTSGNRQLALGSMGDGGFVTTYSPSGKHHLVALSSTNNGGFVEVTNKTGEDIVTLGADDYGNGVVGAWDRKGKGRTLEGK
jgi:hypothetical protein